MPSLVVIGQQIKEKQRGHNMPPSLYNNKIPQPDFFIDVRSSTAGTDMA